MGTAYNIYKHEAKDYTTLRLLLYGIFFVVVIIMMILTVASNPF